MKPLHKIALPAMAIVFAAVACNDSTEQKADETADKSINPTVLFGGFESQVKWGEHLVQIGGCNDCHTPKKMGPNGMEPDMSLMLSGHPAKMPPPPFDQKEAAAKGLAVSQTLTAWVGPWGISYAANITSDSTGIGNWKEDQFMNALRKGKYKGLDAERGLLPPMPWQSSQFMSDDEIKAIFAYLKSTPAINNVVPMAVIAPPPTASAGR